MSRQILVGSFVLLLTLVTSTASQERTNPIAGLVRAELKDPAQPFMLLIRVAVKEGTAPKAEAALTRALPASLNDKGCLDYTIFRDTQQSNRFLVYERWEHFDCFKAHTETEHITKLLDEMRDLLAAAPDIRVVVPALR
jgi:quinol monooxygenase YgiN